MDVCENFVICGRSEFDGICQSAQYVWEEIERSYRDYDGDVIDGEKYHDLYVFRLQRILEGVFPKSHQLIDEFEGHEPLARFLIEESDDLETSYSEFYIEYESDDLYEALCDLASDYT